MNVFEARLKRSWCTIALAVVTLSGCNVKIAGHNNTVIIEGVVASNGMPLKGANVAAGAEFVLTGTDGTFRVEVPAASERVPLKVTLAKFAPAITVVERRAGVFHYHADIEMTPPTMSMMSTGSALEATLNAGGQTFVVRAPPGVVPSGARLELTALAPQNGPGAMETTEGDDQRLQTGGMLYVRAVDANDVEVPLQGAGIQVTPATVAAVPDAQPMKGYQLDEQARWFPQAGTNATGADLTAQQAGFWNADRAFRTACLKGKLAAGMKACGGERVKAGGLDGIYSHDTAGADGSFCVDGPQGWSQSLTVGATTKMVRFPAAAGSCRTSPGECSDMGELKVNDTDCPKSCNQDQNDEPNGCEDKPVETGTGGGGGGGGTGVGCGPPSFGGCSALGSSFSTSRTNNGCCTYTSCSQGGTIGNCSDGCGNGWYEVGSKTYGPCNVSGGNTSCLNNAAKQAVAACP